MLAPIAVGMLANKYLSKAVQTVIPLTPVVGVLSTCFLVASAVAQVAPTIISAGLALQVSCLHVNIQHMHKQHMHSYTT